VAQSRDPRASQIEAERLRYLESDEFERRMEAHVRSATQQAAEESKRLHAPVRATRDPRSTLTGLVSTVTRLLQRLTHAR
jgi:hypothetical protein